MVVLPMAFLVWLVVVAERLSIGRLFSDFLDIANTFHAGLTAAMMAIEFAFQKGWHMLWLEFGSLLVLLNLRIWVLGNLKLGGKIVCTSSK